MRRTLSVTMIANHAIFFINCNVMKVGEAMKESEYIANTDAFRITDKMIRTLEGPLSAAILNASRPRRRGLFIPKYTSSIIWPDFNLVEEICLPLNIECGVRARLRACERVSRTVLGGGGGGGKGMR